MSNILILTETGDVHAYAVAEALRRKGANPMVWHTSDFPTRGNESVLFEDGVTLSISDTEIDLTGMDIDAVWHRRPAIVLDEERLHPADREFAEMACRGVRDGIYEMLAPDAFWVNRRSAGQAAQNKITQQRVAVSLGISMPDTLFSNDPAAIRGFIRRHGGRIAFKPLKGMPWRDETNYYMPYTALITEETLVADHLLRAAPGIYQAVVPKAFELRVTVMGERVFAAKVLSQETNVGKVDWRMAYGELRMEPFTLPAHIEAQCVAMVRRMGLAFGALDFIVTPSGDYQFLECNQMGQFLFVEAYSGIPLLDAFAEYLIQRRRDFTWRETADSVRYEEVRPAIDAMSREAHQRHVVAPPRNFNEAAA